MKRPLMLITFFALCIGACMTEEKPTVFPYDTIQGVEKYHATLLKAFPGMTTCSYHINGEAIMGVFHQKKNRRILLVASPETGVFNVIHNGKRVSSKEFTPAIITLRHSITLPDGKKQFTPDSTMKLRVGCWIPFSLKDTLDFSGVIDHHAKADFSVTYHPDVGWASTLGKPVFEKQHIKKADAYHFSEDSLLEDVRAVLKKQPTCRVKLRRNQILTAKPWKLDKDAILWPVIIKIGAKVSINEKEAEEFMEDQFELNSRLEGYVATAMAGAAVPQVRLRITPKANDENFRATLLTIRETGIRTILLEEVPK